MSATRKYQLSRINWRASQMKAIQTRTMATAISIQFWNVTPQCPLSKIMGWPEAGR